MTLTAAQILGRLEDIDKDLQERQKPVEEAAEAFRRTGREMELRLAKGRLAATGDTQTEKKDRALVAIAASDDDLYDRHKDAEATYEGLKAVVKVLETRTSIGQSLLKWQRETGG